MTDLLHRVNTVEAGAYVAQISGQLLKYKNSSVENASVLCVSQDYDRIKSFELKEGNDRVLEEGMAFHVVMSLRKFAEFGVSQSHTHRLANA